MRIAPRAKVPMLYDQRLDPPFLLTMMPDGLCLWDLDFRSAIDEFVRYALPPSHELGGACVGDSNGVIAIGFASNPYSDPALQWVGTRAAVDLLRQNRLVEPLLLASIEMALEPK